MRAPVARAAADLRLLRAAVFAAVCVTLSAAGHVFAAGQALSAWTLLAGFAAVLATAVPLAGRERSLPGIAALLALGQLALHFLFSCGQAGHAVPAAPAPAAPDRGDGGVLALAGRLLCNDRAAAALSEAEAHRIVADAGLSGALPGGHTAAGAADAVAGTVTGSAADCLRYAVQSALSLLSGPMLLGHLLAALTMGWLLRRGDAALWRLVRLSAHFADGLAGGLGGPLVRALRTALRCVRALLRGLLPEDAVPVRASRADAAGGPVPPASLLPAHSVIRRGPPTARDLALAA
ncbi:hypothetical protein ACGRHY_12810 [Streptomyces sp. HK10]|uniref:hypothetical protein n=1 Tax=Streptomyces sp. HK10 TaxID=3373255 RepID=UPI003749A7DF